MTALRCDTCQKSVLKLTPEQEQQVRYDPGRYTYVCADCAQDAIEKVAAG